MATPMDAQDLTFYPALAAQDAPGATWVAMPLTDVPDSAVSTAMSLDTTQDTAPINDPRRVWLWGPPTLTYEATPDTINALTVAGWEPLSKSEPGHDQQTAVAYHLWAQLRNTCGVLTPRLNDIEAVGDLGSPREDELDDLRDLGDLGGMTLGDMELWARSDDLRAVERCPVALCFSLTPYPVDNDTNIMFANQRRYGESLHISVPEVLPPPTLGAGALVWKRDAGEREIAWRSYDLTDLPPTARQLQTSIAEALRALAAPHSWYTGLLPPQSILEEIKSGAQEAIREECGRTRQWAIREVKSLNAARERLEQMRQARDRYSRETWLERWAEVQQMAQDLAAAYWKHHQAVTREPRARSLPALTSASRVRLPSSNHWRSVTQSFGPGVQPSLWNVEQKGPIELLTPNNGHIRLDGKDANINAALHTYVSQWLKPEGLKHLIGIMDAYYLQTQGRDQKADARVSLRQLLLRMGKTENQADDPKEQERLYHTILYLSHCAVTVDEKRMVEDGRHKRKKKVRMTATPVLVIERIEFEKDGKLHIPTDVEYHLGKDNYEMLFGPEAQYFTVPSAALQRYHAEREQVELMLGLHLCNHITMSDGSYRPYLHTLMLQSGLRSDSDLTSGDKRLEDAERALLALERLEQDGFHLRSQHQHIDAALAAALALGKCRPDQLAPATLARLREPPYASISQADTAQLRETRRRALQRLMAARPGVKSAIDQPITFKAGPLLREQAAKRAAQRQAAIERDERALAARVVKQAIPRVVDALQGVTGGTKPGQKRRGRPRKAPDVQND